MISMVHPLPIGNALRLFLQPQAGAVLWRVLRKDQDDFSGPDDPSALLVHEGDMTGLLDAELLPNGVQAFYRPYYQMPDQSWVAGPTATGTPAATYQDLSTDALTVVRDRLEAGLQVEVERGAISSQLGYVQAFTAPPVFDVVHFPAVTIHVESEQPSDRGIGDYIGYDALNAIGDRFTDSGGWFSDVHLQIIGWSMNADERAMLRQAIRRVIVGNLSVFSGLGLDLVSLQQSDVDAMNGEYGVPQMFQTVGSFTCLAPVRVAGDVVAVRNVNVSARSYDDVQVQQ